MGKEIIEDVIARAAGQLVIQGLAKNTEDAKWLIYCALSGPLAPDTRLTAVLEQKARLQRDAKAAFEGWSLGLDIFAPMMKLHATINALEAGGYFTPPEQAPLMTKDVGRKDLQP